VSGAPTRAANAQAQQLRAQQGREIELVCELSVSLLDAPRQELDETMLRLAQHYASNDMSIADDPVVLDAALTLPLLSWTDGITDGKCLIKTFHLAAIASELAPERFYLPREVLTQLREPWVPEHTRKILDPMTRAAGSQRPVRREAPKLGRNALCPCGSSKKHKRCCGARGV
jgi:hypothetical protein